MTTTIVAPNGKIFQQGWYPRFRYVVRSSDGKLIMYVFDWRGGFGEKPPTGYLTAAGELSQNPDDADAFPNDVTVEASTGLTKGDLVATKIYLDGQEQTANDRINFVAEGSGYSNIGANGDSARLRLPLLPDGNQNGYIVESTRDFEKKQIQFLWGNYSLDYELTTAIGEQLGVRYGTELAENYDFIEIFPKVGPLDSDTTVRIYKLVSGAGEVATSQLQSISARLQRLQQDYNNLAANPGTSIPTNITGFSYDSVTRMLTLRWSHLGVPNSLTTGPWQQVQSLTNFHQFRHVNSPTELSAVPTDGNETVIVLTAFGTYSAGDILTYSNGAWSTVINLVQAIQIADGSVTEQKLAQAVRDSIAAKLDVAQVDTEVNRLIAADPTRANFARLLQALQSTFATYSATVNVQISNAWYRAPDVWPEPKAGDQAVLTFVEVDTGTTGTKTFDYPSLHDKMTTLSQTASGVTGVVVPASDGASNGYAGVSSGDDRQLFSGDDIGTYRWTVSILRWDALRIAPKISEDDLNDTVRQLLHASGHTDQQIRDLADQEIDRKVVPPNTVLSFSFTAEQLTGQFSDNNGIMNANQTFDIGGTTYTLGAISQNNTDHDLELRLSATGITEDSLDGVFFVIDGERFPVSHGVQSVGTGTNEIEFVRSAALWSVGDTVTVDVVAPIESANLVPKGTAAQQGYVPHWDEVSAKYVLGVLRTVPGANSLITSMFQNNAVTKDKLALNQQLPNGAANAFLQWNTRGTSLDNVTEIPATSLPASSATASGIITSAQFAKIANALTATILHEAALVNAAGLEDGDAVFIDDASVTTGSQVRKVVFSELDKRFKPKIATGRWVTVPNTDPLVTRIEPVPSAANNGTLLDVNNKLYLSDGTNWIAIARLDEVYVRGDSQFPSQVAMPQGQENQALLQVVNRTEVSRQDQRLTFPTYSDPPWNNPTPGQGSGGLTTGISHANNLPGDWVNASFFSPSYYNPNYRDRIRITPYRGFEGFVPTHIYIRREGVAQASERRLTLTRERGGNYVSAPLGSIRPRKVTQATSFSINLYNASANYRYRNPASESNQYVPLTNLRQRKIGEASSTAFGRLRNAGNGVWSTGDEVDGAIVAKTAVPANCKIHFVVKVGNHSGRVYSESINTNELLAMPDVDWDNSRRSSARRVRKEIMSTLSSDSAQGAQATDSCYQMGITQVAYLWVGWLDGYLVPRSDKAAMWTTGSAIEVWLDGING